MVAVVGGGQPKRMASNVAPTGIFPNHTNVDALPNHDTPNHDTINHTQRIHSPPTYVARLAEQIHKGGAVGIGHKVLETALHALAHLVAVSLHRVARLRRLIVQFKKLLKEGGV